MKKPQIQRLMFLFALAGVISVAANFACLEDVCAPLKTAEFRTQDDMMEMRIQTLSEALSSAGLNADEAALGLNDGTSQKSSRMPPGFEPRYPVKLADGTVVMPDNWLPEIPVGHPWNGVLTPADDAFYSYFEQRVLMARLFDPSNPIHQEWAQAYLEKSRSNSPEFVGWTYADRTECDKKKFDAEGTMAPPDALLFM